MNPAVEWVSRPSRPSEDLPSSRAATSSGRRDPLERRAERELARMQDERLVGLHLDEARQVGLILRRIDERVLVVVEQPEVPVEAHVHARRLHHRRVPRVESDALRIDLRADVAVREQHAPSLARRIRGGGPGGWGQVRAGGVASGRCGRGSVRARGGGRCGRGSVRAGATPRIRSSRACGGPILAGSPPHPWSCARPGADSAPGRDGPAAASPRTFRRGPPKTRRVADAAAPRVDDEARRPVRTCEPRGRRAAASGFVMLAGPPRGGARGCSSMAELQLPKLIARVRFPSSPPLRVRPFGPVRSLS